MLTTRGGDVLVMRGETDAAQVRTVPRGTFTSDGVRLAYWTGTAGAELHVMDPSGNDRVVASFADRRGAGIAWSTDGTGLLVALGDVDPRFFIARTLVAVDIASGATRQIHQLSGSGPSIVPLVWRRDPEIFAAYETGPGGYSFGYTVIRPGQPAIRTDPGAEAQSVGFAASSDGALVAGLWLREGTLKVWPVDDFAKQTDLKPADGEQAAQHRWWPDRRELAVAVARKSDGVFRDGRIERWDPASGARVVLKRLADSNNLGAYFVRADGTGLLTQGPFPPGAWEVTDLRTGTSAAVPLLQGEVILQTVQVR